MRKAEVKRRSKETDIKVKLNLDGKGETKVSSGIGFFDHMLEAMAKHGLFDLDASISGDLHVDQHHTIEDTGIVLGQAFKQALGDKKGISRSGFFLYPMDEALAMAVVDISGRPYTAFFMFFLSL